MAKTCQMHTAGRQGGYCLATFTLMSHWQLFINRSSTTHKNMNAILFITRALCTHSTVFSCNSLCYSNTDEHHQGNYSQWLNDSYLKGEITSCLCPHFSLRYNWLAWRLIIRNLFGMGFDLVLTNLLRDPLSSLPHHTGYFGMPITWPFLKP